MTKEKIKKLSVLGLVLLAASAVTAAVLPSSDNAPLAGFSMTGTDTEAGDGTTQSCHATDVADAGVCLDETFTAGNSGSTSAEDDGTGESTVAGGTDVRVGTTDI